eukprot:5711803-Pyramimonas_sp.AAC.1
MYNDNLRTVGEDRSYRFGRLLAWRSHMLQPSFVFDASCRLRRVVVYVTKGKNPRGGGGGGSSGSGVGAPLPAAGD